MSENRSPLAPSNQPLVWVTTSWDDGYPLDLRLAELLHRYDIEGTFYVPIRSQLPVMTAGQIQGLSRHFEIGGHTVNHVRLDQVGAQCGREEISGAKRHIEDITGKACTMFCPPAGRFSRSHLAAIRNAGYAGVRTVELMSVRYPAYQNDLSILGTTLQLYPHTASVYFKNAVKRGRWNNFKTYFLRARSAGLERAASCILDSLLASGGVFHLWGHSSELEHSGLWGTLTSILRLLHQNRDRCRFVTNGALVKQLRPKPGPTGEPDERPADEGRSIAAGSGGVQRSRYR